MLELSRRWLVLQEFWNKLFSKIGNLAFANKLSPQLKVQVLSFLSIQSSIHLPSYLSVSPSTPCTCHPPSSPPICLPVSLLPPQSFISHCLFQEPWRKWERKIVDSKLDIDPLVKWPHYIYCPKCGTSKSRQGTTGNHAGKTSINQDCSGQIQT